MVWKYLMMYLKNCEKFSQMWGLLWRWLFALIRHQGSQCQVSIIHVPKVKRLSPNHKIHMILKRGNKHLTLKNYVKNIYLLVEYIYSQEFIFFENSIRTHSKSRMLIWMRFFKKCLFLLLREKNNVYTSQNWFRGFFWHLPAVFTLFRNDFGNSPIRNHKWMRTLRKDFGTCKHSFK